MKRRVLAGAVLGAAGVIGLLSLMGSFAPPITISSGYVPDPLRLAGDLGVDGGAIIAEDFIVGGLTSAEGGLVVNDGARVDSLDVSGVCGIDGGLLVFGGVQADTGSFSGTLRVDGGAAVWGDLGLGGSATVQGDVAVAGNLRAVDGGSIDFAGEAHLWGNNRVCFADAGSCIYDNNNVLTIAGKDAVSISNPLNAVGIARAGQQMNNYLELNGSAVGSPVTIKAFGAATDIQVQVEPKGDGGFRVKGRAEADAELLTPTVVTNTCSRGGEGIEKSQVVELLADAGTIVHRTVCDGEFWLDANNNVDYGGSVSTNYGAGSVVLSIAPEATTGQVRFITWTSHGGGSAGTAGIVVQQSLPDGGLRVLCELPVDCGLVKGARIRAFCGYNRWVRGVSDGGFASDIVAAWDAGCTNTPAGHFTVRTAVGICPPGHNVPQCQPW